MTTICNRKLFSQNCMFFCSGIPEVNFEEKRMLRSENSYYINISDINIIHNFYHNLSFSLAYFEATSADVEKFYEVMRRNHMVLLLITD